MRLKPGSQYLVMPTISIALVLLSSIIPSPANYWTTVFAVLVGPGWGIPRLMLLDNKLSKFEEILIVILSSLCIITSTLSSLNSSSILLTRRVVGFVLISSTVITTSLALYRDAFINLVPRGPNGKMVERKSSHSLQPILDDRPKNARWDVLAFFLGFLLCIVLVFIVLQLI